MAPSVVGIVATLAVVATSAMANVYNQFILQYTPDQPLMLQNLFLYGYGVIFNLINWGRSIYYTAGPPRPAFGEVTLSVVLLIVFTAIYGLCISAVLKSLGAIVRSILAVLAIVVTAAGEYFLFNTVPSLFTGTTFLVITVSAQAYSQVPRPALPK